MTRLFVLVLAVFFPAAAPATAQDAAGPAATQAEPAARTPPETAAEPLIRPAGESDLSEFKWTRRVLVVFADSPADPRFMDQIEFLRDGEDMLRERDVVVLTDSDPSARTPVRQKLRPRGFQLTLVDKDGEVKLRKPLPWTVREIAASIDKTPMRLREVEERRRKKAGAAAGGN